MNDKMIEEFGEIMMNVYADRDSYSRGKIIDLAKQAFAEVVNKNCNLQSVMRCVCCGNTTKFSDGEKQQILIEDEYRYIYAVTCDECGKVCDVELFD